MSLKGQNCFPTVNVKILKLKCTVLDHTVQREGTFLLRSLPKYVPSLQKNLTNRDCRVYVSHLKTVFQAEEGDIVEKCYSYAV